MVLWAASSRSNSDFNSQYLMSSFQTFRLRRDTSRSRLNFLASNWSARAAFACSSTISASVRVGDEEAEQTEALEVAMLGEKTKDGSVGGEETGGAERRRAAKVGERGEETEAVTKQRTSSEEAGW